MESFYEKYQDALLRELRSLALNEEKKGIKREKGYSSIFFGGGTPSYYPSEFIRQLLDETRSLFAIPSGCEITIECNPDSLTEEKVREYYDSGINRISIGLQAAQDHLLKSIGRIHDLSDFERGYSVVRESGIENVNVDLIEGLPGQSISDFDETLRYIIDKEPEHISVYALSIEENSIFGKRRAEIERKIPDDDTEREMYWSAHERLKANGYVHYEISNYCKPDFESRHNVLCWKGREYYGIGAGAHSYSDGMRYSNYKDPATYITAVDKAINTNDEIERDERIIIDETEKRKEFFLLGFRLLEGVSENEFITRFKQGLESFLPDLNDLISSDFITFENGRYKLTPKGIDYANLVFRRFV